ncbi:MAG: hypothetical protein ABWZ66_13450 [Pyrinomonadaceae bacterium]
MSNKNFPLGEKEILSGDEEKICELLGNLQRVDAPKDFDFQLKARIANAKPQDFRAAPRLFPILRYAAPLGLAIIVLAVVVINGLYSFDNNSVPTVAGNYVQKPAANVNFPIVNQPNTVEIAETTPSAKDTEIFPAIAVNSAKPEKRIFSRDSELAGNIKKPKNSEAQPKNNGGSLVQSSGNPSVLLPNGFNPNNSYSVKEILSINGIEADFSNKKWKVKSVAQNSIAERSGVKANDVIEAINDRKLSAETVASEGRLNVNKLTVARGREKIEINLKNE